MKRFLLVGSMLIEFFSTSSAQWQVITDLDSSMYGIYFTDDTTGYICGRNGIIRKTKDAGASWTTDAPFRETEEMIDLCRKQGILAVEMEAAALYALAEVKQYEIICFAHVTNQMGQTEGDFEKGQAQGSLTALRILSQTVAAWKVL